MIEQASSMSPVSRRQEIVDELARWGERSVDQLADRFKVSGMTIRRDLQDLADAGRLVRTHGGAAPASRISFEFRFLERARQCTAEKDAIAAAAAEIVTDGQSVMLDSGTTTLALARRLRDRKNITVITTSLPIASELFGCENIRLLLLGGFLQHDTPDLLGAITDTNLETLHADLAFIGADGVADDGAVYNHSPALAGMLTRMARASGTVYVVADHTKVGRKALVQFGNLSEFAGLITDTGADRKVVAALRRQGIPLTLASPSNKEITT